MVIQFGDVINILKDTIHSNTYNFFFFFIHSAGNDQSKPYELNANSSNKCYRFDQQELRNGKIEITTCHGPFH